MYAVVLYKDNDKSNLRIDQAAHQFKQANVRESVILKVPFLILKPDSKSAGWRANRENPIA